MTVSIVDFLKARIREDEKWARLVSAPPSELDPEPVDGVHWDWVVGPDCEPLDIPDPFSKEANGMLTETGTIAWLSTVEKYHLVEGDDPAPGIYSDGIHNMEGPTAAHIARHDPARVLREVAAKRAILEDHRIIKADIDTEEFDLGCERCHFNRDEGVAGCGYCPTLKALAAVYGDHPDYDERWKP
jgi:hypothetical protein